jgi:excisionase family DNA binding protein
MSPTVEPQEPLAFDVPTVARVIARSDRKVRELIADGHLPARRLPGGRVVILRDDLLAFLQNLPPVVDVAGAGG